MAGAVDRLNSRRGKKLPSFQKLLKEQRAETNRGSVCCSKGDVELGIPALTSYFPDTKSQTWSHRFYTENTGSQLRYTAATKMSPRGPARLEVKSGWMQRRDKM